MNSSRILERLQKAELAEPNTHLRSDIRQAFIVVSLAGRGEPEPFIQSSYRIYGIHPDKVFPRWLAEQKAKLGAEFGRWYDDRGCLIPDISVPKRPPTREAVFHERLAHVLPKQGVA